MSREILIPLAIACNNISCGACQNYINKHCNVFGKKPRILEKAFSEVPERLIECIEAESFAKGDWQADLRKVRGQ